MAEPEYYEVAGIPVAIGHIPGSKHATYSWDQFPPRPFDPYYASLYGEPITQCDFEEMVQDLRDRLVAADLPLDPYAEVEEEDGLFKAFRQLRQKLGPHDAHERLARQQRSGGARTPAFL
jgi:hypothetical protein